MEDTNFRVTSDFSEIKSLSINYTGNLAKLYFDKRVRKSSKWLHYLDLYDRYLSPYCNPDERLKILGDSRPLKFLEIGINDGGSFEIWRKYFGKDASLFGIDIREDCREKVNELNLNCHARIGSQADPDFICSVVDEMGGVDIVIDDGSHIASHQLSTFRTLFPKISNGGLYICEDLHTSYWQDWQGGYKRAGTFIEVVKNAIDSIHRWYYPIKNDLSDMELHQHISGIHIHDSIVIIEKRRVSPPLMMEI